jgi:hypothetical protein
MIALGYAWQIGANLLYLAVVWYVLERFDQRPESVIVPILGMLYVTIRYVGLGVYSGVVALAVALDDVQKRLQAPDPSAYVPDEETVKARRRMDHQQIKAYLESIFIAIISLLCVWKFFTAM